MEELFELRSHIEQRHYAEALVLIGEMEEMSKDDKINRIHSYSIIALMHLIKQHAEKRSTHSWETSICNSVEKIGMTNKRRKTGGFYLKEDELKEILAKGFKAALRNASLEAFEGHYDVRKLARMVDEEKIRKEALQLILEEQANI